MKAKGLTAERFAAMVDASPFTVGKWARDERIPRPDAMARIEAATGGEVTAIDFYRSADRAA